MFETGFLGTKAPFYMDLITIYFGLLPLLMGSAIIMAMKKKFDMHYKMQLSTFIVTLVVVVIFEIGVRLSGGFNEFMNDSNANYSAMAIFLAIHVIVAVISVVIWAILIYSAIREYKFHKKPIIRSHAKLGRWVYFGMSATAIMGVSIYYFLFAY